MLVIDRELKELETLKRITGYERYVKDGGSMKLRAYLERFFWSEDLNSFYHKVRELNNFR